MNSIADLYTLELEVHGSSSFLDARDADLSLSDSIYSIYPRAKMSLNDSSGIFLESRIATLGLDFVFTIGYNNEDVTIPFVVNNFQTIDQKYSQYMNGQIEIDLIHSFITKFTSESKAYSDVPSEIVRSIVQNEKFKGLSIERTNRIQDSPYYNPGLSFKDFINTILLPNSRSSENSEEPFYCFIDSSNRFHYETLSNMFDRSPSKSLVYRVGRKDIKEVQKILDFRPYTAKLENIHDYLNFDLFYFDKSGSLELEKEEKRLVDNINSRMNIFDLYNQKYIIFNDKFSSSTSIEQATIKLNNLKKKNFLTDKIVVTTLLDTSVRAGITVDLDVDYESESTSASYSGKYLVEGTKHSWNSKEMKGYTQMILSRQKTEYPIQSKITGELMK